MLDAGYKLKSQAGSGLAVAVFIGCMAGCLIFGCQALSAQLVTGTITGTVTDQSGAAVPGAELRLTNTATNVVQQATSDGNGSFQFLLLTSGAYALEASRSGFKSFRRDGIAVESARSMADSRCTGSRPGDRNR